MKAMLTMWYVSTRAMELYARSKWRLSTSLELLSEEEVYSTTNATFPYSATICWADYVELTPPQVVTLPDGPAGQACFRGDIVDDKLALEPLEQFSLRLRDPVMRGIIIGNDKTTVSIIDDDGITSRIRIDDSVGRHTHTHTHTHTHSL